MIGDAWVIVGATKRIEADLADFAKHRDQLTQSMLKSRQDQMFEEYISTITDRLKRAGKIKIYVDVLNHLAEDE